MVGNPLKECFMSFIENIFGMNMIARTPAPGRSVFLSCNGIFPDSAGPVLMESRIHLGIL